MYETGTPVVLVLVLQLENRLPYLGRKHIPAILTQWYAENKQEIDCGYFVWKHSPSGRFDFSYPQTTDICRYIIISSFLIRAFTKIPEAMNRKRLCVFLSGRSLGFWSWADLYFFCIYKNLRTDKEHYGLNDDIH